MTEKANFTIGCDPEFFLKKEGKLISAIPFLTGTKWEPTPLTKGNIQKDNVAVEVATRPASSIEEFIDNIKTTLSEATKMLPEGSEIVAVPSASFSEDQLKDPEALAFGCEPDYCAWDVAENPRPKCSDVTFRSCGAHIHVGTTGEDENAFLLSFEGKLNTVKAMDCFHGIISTVLDSSKEALDRRKLYGKPGAHRPKDYGVEYRVLSNYWLKSPVTVMLMYHMVIDALKVIRENKLDELVNNIGGGKKIKDIIMSGDVKEALRVIESFVMPLMSKDSVFYFNEAIAKIKADDMHLYKEWEMEKKG